MQKMFNPTARPTLHNVRNNNKNGFIRQLQVRRNQKCIIPAAKAGICSIKYWSWTFYSVMYHIKVQILQFCGPFTKHNYLSARYCQLLPKSQFRSTSLWLLAMTRKEQKLNYYTFRYLNHLVFFSHISVCNNDLAKHASLLDIQTMGARCAAFPCSTPKAAV